MAQTQKDCARLKDDLTRIVLEQSAVRSDVFALKNLYANNQLSEKLLELSKRVDSGPSLEQQALLKSDVDAIKARLNDARNMERQLSEKVSDLFNRIETYPNPEQQKLLRRDIDSIKARYTNDQNMARYLAVTNTNNGLFIGKPGDIISDHIFAGGQWDSHILTLAKEVSMKSSGIAIDVGAHFGALTLSLSNIFHEVLSFEPNDFNFCILRGNVAINHLKNVRIFNYPLYSKETTMSLGEEVNQEIPIRFNVSGEFDGHLSSNLGAYFFSEGPDRSFVHLAKTLDSLELSNVSFIKIDVQGADGEVLMGAMDTIKRCRPVVVFEWEEYLSHHFSVSFDKLRKEFESLDYELSPLKVHNEKQIDFVARPHSGGA